MAPPHGFPPYPYPYPYPYAASGGWGHQPNARDRTPWGGGQPNARQLTGAIKDCRALCDLSRLLHEQRGAMNQIHVSAAWVCLVRIGTDRGAGDVGGAVAALQDRTRDVLGQVGGRQISNIMHSTAKLYQMGVPADEVLLAALQRRATATVGEFNPQGVGNVLWALATMKARVDRVLLEAMQRRSTATAWEFQPQNVANVLWALATMGERADPGLLEAMQRRATATAWEWTPQHVGNVLWALATMGERADRVLLEAMQWRATATAGEFKPKEVANVLWALATMGEKAGGGMLEAMQRWATALAREFNPQDVGNVLWALATMGERADRGLLQTIGVRATATAGEFKPQNVANLLWALATMGVRADRGLLEVMQRRATATAEGFNPQDVANVIWALATMGERVDRGLLEVMQRRATATAGEFQPQNIANVMWALATMGEKPDRGVLEAIGVRAIATAGEFNSQDVGNVLWALAVMGEVFTGFPVALIDLFASHVLESRDLLNLKEKAQLHQWLLSHELDLVSGASLPSSVARVKQEIGEECLQAFTGQGSSESRLQRDVAAELKRVWSEVEMEEEYRDARSGYSIDVLVRRRSAAGSTEWAVEVDGPSHFLADARTPSGSTLLKRKQLGQLGYTVVPVPFWEWDALRGEEAKRWYLEGKLIGGELRGGGVWRGWGPVGA
ncbi:hypothetical protein T484DRAFT_1790559 [Baffinella frigidus]|nr:hypothetical protein T484DRAFT_1790559 [Cryptophyta sp. CCMP2293]